MNGQPEVHNEATYQPVEHRIIATWPQGSFVENIAARGDCFVISVHNQRQLLEVARDGSSKVLAAMPASPAGLVVTDHAIFAVAGEPGQGPHHLYKISFDGAVERVMAVPDTLFLNGFTPAHTGHAYAVDSIAGIIIEIDLVHATSRIVLRDEQLAKCSSEPMLPGVNGIKMGDGALFLTNTDRALVLRAELGDKGLTGDLAVIAEHLRGDDLALDMEGNLYITNHIHNTLIRLKPNGERFAIAGPDEGMAGSTACVFTAHDPGGLYVTTTGGIVMPFNGVLQEAKLVRLETGAIGRPISFQSGAGARA